MKTKKFLQFASFCVVILHNALATDDQLIASLRRIRPSAPVPHLSVEMMIAGESKSAQRMRDVICNPGVNPDLLKGKVIGILTTDGAESPETMIPANFFKARGATIELIAPKKRIQPGLPVEIPAARDTEIFVVEYMENVGTLKIDRYLESSDPSRYDVIFMPGGIWAPDNLRVNTDVHRFLQRASKVGTLIAATGHSPLILINAGMLKGKKATSYWSVQVDLSNAGALVYDRPVVVDGGLLTSRFPTDFPDFLEAIVQKLTLSYQEESFAYNVGLKCCDTDGAIPQKKQRISKWQRFKNFVGKAKVILGYKR